MKYLISVFFSVFIMCSLNAQYNKIGALKIKNGVLVYNNEDASPYIINFYGNIDLSKFPFVSIDENMFQFNGCFFNLIFSYNLCFEILSKDSLFLSVI